MPRERRLAELGQAMRATGEPTPAGVTRRLELGIERFSCTRLPSLVRLTCGAGLAASLRRSDFDPTAYAGLVGEEVRLEIQVEAVRVEAAPQTPTDG